MPRKALHDTTPEESVTHIRKSPDKRAAEAVQDFVGQGSGDTADRASMLSLSVPVPRRQRQEARFTLYVSKAWIKGVRIRAKYYGASMEKLIQDATKAGAEIVLERYELKRYEPDRRENDTTPEKPVTNNRRSPDKRAAEAVQDFVGQGFGDIAERVSMISMGAPARRPQRQAARLGLYVSKAWIKGVRKRAKHYGVSMAKLIRDSTKAGMETVLERYQQGLRKKVEADRAMALWEPPGP